MTNVAAFYTTNNAYNSIVIPQTNTCFLNPSDKKVAEFYAEDANFADWDGDSIDEQVDRACLEDLSEYQIAELFGEIIHSRYC